MCKQEEVGEEEDVEDSTTVEEDLTSPLSIVLNHVKHVENSSSSSTPTPASSSSATAVTILTAQTTLQGQKSIKCEKGAIPEPHIVDTNTRESTLRFKCKKCPKRFINELQVMYHMHQHFQQNRVKRLVRHKHVISTLNLKQNLYVYGSKLNEKTGKTSEKHQCKQCGKEFSMRVLYTKHFNQCHVKCFKCPSCLKPFPWPALPLHMALKHPVNIAQHPEERHHCRICQQGFLHTSTLRNHRHDSSKQQVNYRCPEDSCGFQTKQTSRLGEHVEQLHPHVSFSCQHEGCSFTAPLQLLIQRYHLLSPAPF